jgi:hypothetical protein
MKEPPPHLKALEEIEREGIPGLVEVLREESIDAVRYVLWDVTGWHRDYSPAAWRNRATEEQKRIGWEMAVRMEKIICTVLHEAHERQVEEAMDTLAEGPEGRSYSQALTADRLDGVASEPGAADGEAEVAGISIR